MMYKTTPYKFKVGDVVTYDDGSYADTDCPTCGCSMYKYIESQVTATVVKRLRENPNNYYTIPTFTTVDEVEVIDGKKVIRPRIESFEEMEKRKRMYNVYTLSDGSKQLERNLSTQRNKNN